ncbi:MAG: phosphoglycerate kinase [Oscillospiraceae bacterium]|jgi:phosphoglycerate kinase|nr:phosphoglycerate kinase [Oscillospiraceae bacterium]
MNKKSISNANLNGKKVIVRCDFNVPISYDGFIVDDRRITEALPTIKFLVQQGARVILCSHFGRPHGKVQCKLSLEPVAIRLNQYFENSVKFVKDVIGTSACKVSKNLENGEICLLENLRFEIGEEKNEDSFAKSLASLAEVYVNDAFGACHREHASIVGVPKFLPSYFGFLVQKEIKEMSEVIKNPKRPFVSILGGSKVSDKIGVIKNLIDKVDTFIIGGGMAYTFMNALGYSVGDSICEKDRLELARDIMEKTKEKGVRFLLPVDNKVGKEYSPETEFKVVGADKIPNGWQGLDIGPRTCEIFSNEIKNAGTIVWNGPMGVSEWDNFSQGTFSVARAVAESESASIVGGGDSAVAIKKIECESKITHISTGGGASLMFLEGIELPGIKAISDRPFAKF